MSDESAQPDTTIHTDEDWKARVKAEDAALDEQLQAETAPPTPESINELTEESADSSDAGQIDPAAMPPATFSTLLAMFSTQAMVSLGVIPNPATGKAELQPHLARHFIDLIAVLEEKSKGNLDMREQNFLDTTLHQLRMAFVEVTRAAANSK